MKIWILSYLFLSTFCFAISTQKVNFSLGYRHDHLTQKGPANIPTTNPNGLIKFFDRTIRDLDLLQLDATIFMSFDEGFFFRGNVGYGWIISSPKIYYHHLLQTQLNGITVIDRHKYALDLLGAIGWQWDLSSMTSIATELGFAFAKLNIDKMNTIQNTIPFLGVQFFSNFGDYFFFNAGLDYYMLGRRKECIQLFNGQILHHINRGFVHGPQLNTTLGYRLNAQCAVNCDFSLRYLMTNKTKDEMLGHWIELKTTWLMYKILLGLIYIF